MALSAGAIGGIASASILAVLILIGVVYFIVKRRKEQKELKYGERNEEMATFPYADPSFVRTPVLGQRFTSRELKQDFVIPGKADEDLERQPLLSMQNPINPDSFNVDLYSSDQIKSTKAAESTHGSGSSRPAQVFLTIEYDETLNILKVFVDQARHLRPSSFANNCDPYFVVSLLPSQQSERQSHVQRKTVDPIFQENFSFELSKEQVKDSLIQIKFYVYDQFSRDECIGIILQRLDELNLSSKVDLWKKITLTASGQVTEKAGDLLLRLGYLPSAEKLTVVLLKARSLKEVGPEGEEKPPDPYIRVSIYHEGNLLKKKKTSTKKKTSNPTYNQAINFSIPLHVLPQIEIHFCVVHESGVKLSRYDAKEEIGFVEIGPQSTGDEKDHWRDLMSNKPQARWHHLTTTANNEPLALPVASKTIQTN